ncbi:MAG TPA: fumarate hydratase [Candidatus Syntrophosphaera thermopropionivorans]|nr:fumarate hydratase [Candidatus Syntrophosphaera thermopropionivorans]
MESVRTIPKKQIYKAIIEAIGQIYCQSTPETKSLLNQALAIEEDDVAKDMLQAMLLNEELAAKKQLPICQDTGIVIVFADIGTETKIENGTLYSIVSEAVNDAWGKYYLRDSIAEEPLRYFSNPQKKSKYYSQPVILHLSEILGNKLELHISLKGGGAENCSTLKMFNPTATLTEIEDFIIDTVVSAGGKPCPPVFVGIGIGGDFEQCTILAKRALMIPLPDSEKKPEYLQMEKRILNKINQKGKGVQGFGGKTTALKVNILSQPCHIASLPVAVNIDCHAHRCISISI